MKWLFKWLRDGINDLDTPSLSSDREYINRGVNVGLAIPKMRKSPRELAAATASDGSIHLNQSPMNFRIYPATGGHIVEYTYYNEKTDRNDQALHLIPSELDLGSELAKIMTLEALKR